MSRSGRGPCAACGANGAVRADGGMHAHWTKDGEVCPGAGKPPGFLDERDAASKLLRLIQQIEDAGYPVTVDHGRKEGYVLDVGVFTFLEAPTLSKDKWKLRTETDGR